MKFLAFIALSLSASFAFATPVDGTLFYKLPSGDIANRDVTLEVPARGQGEVVLSGQNFEWNTTDFWSKKTDQGTVMFYAVFRPEFMDKKSTIVLKGTYVNGNGRVLYYGNFYKRDGHEAFDKDFSDFKFGGGFMFDYTAPTTED